MQYTQLGSTGLEVSQLCPGCMNFGSDEPWMLNDREASVELIHSALDADDLERIEEPKTPRWPGPGKDT